MRRWCAGRNSPARSARRARAPLPPGRFSASDLRGFVALAASQEQQFDVVRRQGSAAQQDALKAAVSAAASAEVARMREAAIMLATGETKDVVAAPAWFTASTARIDELKKFEDRASPPI